MNITREQLRDMITTGRPSHLYKYKFPEYNFLKEIIVDDTLYFPSPNTFNDPFDSFPVFDYTGTEIQLTRMFKELSRERGKIITTREARESARNMKRKRYFQTPSSVSESFRHKIGVFCLSSDNSNILMWSHYAEKHKGVCLEFSNNINDKIFCYSLPVQYKDKYTTHSFLKIGKKNILHDLILTKAKDWSYEKEWRIVSIKGSHLEGPGKYKFNPELLTKIIFGCKADDYFIKRITELNEKRKKPVELWKAKCILNDYKVEIHPLSF